VVARGRSGRRQPPTAPPHEAALADARLQRVAHVLVLRRPVEGFEQVGGELLVGRDGSGWSHARCRRCQPGRSRLPPGLPPWAEVTQPWRPATAPPAAAPKDASTPKNSGHSAPAGAHSRTRRGWHRGRARAPPPHRRRPRRWWRVGAASARARGPAEHAPGHLRGGHCGCGCTAIDAGAMAQAVAIREASPSRRADRRPASR